MTEKLLWDVAGRMIVWIIVWHSIAICFTHALHACIHWKRVIVVQVCLSVFVAGALWFVHPLTSAPAAWFALALYSWGIACSVTMLAIICGLSVRRPTTLMTTVCHGVFLRRRHLPKESARVPLRSGLDVAGAMVDHPTVRDL